MRHLSSIHKVDVGARDADEESLFLFAARAGHLKAFKYLFEIGAPTNVDGAVVSTVCYTALSSTTTHALFGFCYLKSLVKQRRNITVRLY